MKAALYLRVSSNAQDEENQLAPLVKLAASRGWEIATIYREKEKRMKS